MANYKYSYTRLPHDDSIRLIQFHSAVENEIRLHIIDFRLAEAPPYYALSYAWGSAKRSDQVEVPISDGTTLKVTKNCKSAIARLAQASASSSSLFLIWIDAICIDQAHTNSALTERDHQLQLMCSIYKHAEQTLIWLGEDSNGAGNCLDSIRRTSGLVESAEEPWTIESGSDQGSSPKVSLSLPCYLQSLN
jgi:hypothetical protein